MGYVPGHAPAIIIPRTALVLAPYGAANKARANADIKCTGANDDDFINEALESVAVGGVIYLAAGTFSINPRQNQINGGTTYGGTQDSGWTGWLNASVITQSVRITGDKGAILKVATGTSVPGGSGIMVFMVPSGVSDVEICGFTFDGNEDHVTTSYNGLVFNLNADNIQVHHMKFKNGEMFIWGNASETPYTNYNYRVFANDFFCTTDGGLVRDGMCLHNGCALSSVVDNAFFQAATGVQIDSTTGATFAFNKLYQCRKPLFFTDGVYECDISHNHIMELNPQGANAYAIDARKNVSGETTSDKNKIHNNIITNFYQGIITDGTENEIYENTFINLSVTPAIVDNGTNTKIYRNKGYNPVGLVTVAVSASGVASTTSAYDQTFYITNGNASATIAVGSSTVLTLAAGAQGTVTVPAGQTLTWTGTGTAPTWVTYAN